MMPRHMLIQIEAVVADDAAQRTAQEAVSELVVDPRLDIEACRISTSDERRLLPDDRANPKVPR